MQKHIAIKKYLGLDVHKRTVAIAFADASHVFEFSGFQQLGCCLCPAPGMPW